MDAPTIAGGGDGLELALAAPRPPKAKPIEKAMSASAAIVTTTGGSPRPRRGVKRSSEGSDSRIPPHHAPGRPGDSDLRMVLHSVLI